MVRNPWRRSHIEIIVQMLRHLGIPPHKFAVAAVGQANVDVVNPADAAVADQFAGLLELVARALHAAGLKDHTVAGDGVDHRPALGQIVGERLLAVDVLSGIGRRYALRGMPVVGRGDDNRVDIVAGEEFAEVMIGCAILVAIEAVHHLPALGKVLLVDIANREGMRVFLLYGAAQYPACLAAACDAPDGDPVARRRRAVQTQCRAGHDVRKCGRASGKCPRLSQKAPATHSFLGLHRTSPGLIGWPQA